MLLFPCLVIHNWSSYIPACDVNETETRDRVQTDKSTELHSIGLEGIQGRKHTHMRYLYSLLIINFLVVEKSDEGGSNDCCGS